MGSPEMKSNETGNEFLVRNQQPQTREDIFSRVKISKSRKTCIGLLFIDVS